MGGPEAETRQAHIVSEYKLASPALASGGTGRLLVDGKEVDKKELKHGSPIMFPEDETFDVGIDTRTPVAVLKYRYNLPVRVHRQDQQVTFDLGSAQYDFSEK